MPSPNSAKPPLHLRPETPLKVGVDVGMVEESKSRRVEESKSRRVEESKSRRVEESKSRRVEDRPPFQELSSVALSLGVFSPSRRM